MEQIGDVSKHFVHIPFIRSRVGENDRPKEKYVPFGQTFKGAEGQIQGCPWILSVGDRAIVPPPGQTCAIEPPPLWGWKNIIINSTVQDFPAPSAPENPYITWILLFIAVLGNNLSGTLSPTNLQKHLLQMNFNPIYPNLCFLLYFKETIFPKNSKWVSKTAPSDPLSGASCWKSCNRKPPETKIVQ